MSDERASLTRSAARASIAAALFLAALKLWAVWQTSSTAMLGSLADTSLDLIASIATLVGVSVAAHPADEKHRFGHGKAEALAAIFQVILIALSAAAIGFRAILRLVEGGETQGAEHGIAVSVIAIGVTFALIAWQRHVVRRTGSIAIQTDSVHYQSDLLLNLAVIAALVIDQYLGFAQADPLFGLAIAAWLLWGAWRSSRQAIDQLMDREWPQEKRQAFIQRVASHSQISHMHDLRTRSAGGQDLAQFHVDLPGAMTVEAAHDIIHRLEEDLQSAFPDTEVFIHVDPQGHVDDPGNDLAEADEFKALKSGR